MQRYLKKLSRRSEPYIFLVLLVLCVLIEIRSGQFFTPNNIVDKLSALVVPGIFAVGAFMVIVSGGIDVSFPALASLSAFATTKLLLDAGYTGGIWLPILLSLALRRHPRRVQRRVHRLFRPAGDDRHPRLLQRLQGLYAGHAGIPTAGRHPRGHGQLRPLGAVRGHQPGIRPHFAHAHRRSSSSWWCWRRRGSSSTAPCSAAASTPSAATMSAPTAPASACARPSS